MAASASLLRLLLLDLREEELALFFFFNDTATTEIYTLSLHDALPISRLHVQVAQQLAVDHLHVQHLDASAHGHEQVEQTRPGRVQARVWNHQVRLRHNECSGNEKSR